MWRRAAARPKCSCSASTAKEASSWVSSAINESYHTLPKISLDESAVAAIYCRGEVLVKYVGNGLFRNRGCFLHHGRVCPANREVAKAGWQRPVLSHAVPLYGRSAALAG